MVRLICAGLLLVLCMAFPAWADGQQLGNEESEYRNVVVQIDGDYYLFTDSGSMLDNDETYCLTDMSGNRYWFRAMEGGYLYCEEWYTAEPGNSNSRFYYGQGGVAANGVVSVDGNLFLFEENGHLLLNGERTIGEITWISDQFGYATIMQNSADNPNTPNTDNSDNPNNQNPSNSDNTNNPDPPANGLVTLASGEVVYYENGNLCRNRLVEMGSTAYYFQSDGTLLRGGTAQVAEPAASHTGRIRAKIDGSLYKNEYYLDQAENKEYYYGAYYLEARGVIPFSDGYCFFHDDGHMAKSEVIEYDGKHWLFGEDGVLMTGINTLPEGIALCTQEGVYLGMLSVGWNTLDGERYFVRTDGDGNAVLICNGPFMIEWKEYYFDATGRMLHDCLYGEILLGHDGLQVAGGFYELSEGEYYVSPETGRIVRGQTVTVEGTEYNLDENGLLIPDCPASDGDASSEDKEPTTGEEPTANSSQTDKSNDSKDSLSNPSREAEEDDPDAGWIPINETDQQVFSTISMLDYLVYQHQFAASTQSSQAGVLSGGSSYSRTASAYNYNSESRDAAARTGKTSPKPNTCSASAGESKKTKYSPSPHTGAPRLQRETAGSTGSAIKVPILPTEQGLYRMVGGEWIPCDSETGRPVSVKLYADGKRAVFLSSGEPLRNILLLFPNTEGKRAGVLFDSCGAGYWLGRQLRTEDQLMMRRGAGYCLVRS